MASVNSFLTLWPSYAEAEKNEAASLKVCLLLLLDIGQKALIKRSDWLM